MSITGFSPKKGSVKKRFRKARGNASGAGTHAGRGHKGQKSRSGYSRKAGFEGGQTPLFRRTPKLRGLRNGVTSRVLYTPINFSLISLHFEDGDIISIQTLMDKHLLNKNQTPKILGSGDLNGKTFQFDESLIFSNASKKRIK